MKLTVKLEISYTQFFDLVACINAQINSIESVKTFYASECQHGDMLWHRIVEEFDGKITDLNGIRCKLYDAFADRRIN